MLGIEINRNLLSIACFRRCWNRTHVARRPLNPCPISCVVVDGVERHGAVYGMLCSLEVQLSRGTDRCTQKRAPPVRAPFRAGDGIRTHDSLLGKQIRYHCVTPACTLTVYRRTQRKSNAVRHRVWAMAPGANSPRLEGDLGRSVHERSRVGARDAPETGATSDGRGRPPPRRGLRAMGGGGRPRDGAMSDGRWRPPPRRGLRAMGRGYEP